MAGNQNVCVADKRGTLGKRIEQLAKELSAEMGITIRKSDIVRMAIQEYAERHATKLADRGAS